MTVLRKLKLQYGNDWEAWFPLIYIYFFLNINKSLGSSALIQLYRFSVSPGNQKTLFKEVKTWLSYKRLEMHLLKEGKLGALECVIHCATQKRRHSSHDMVDSHPLRLLLMIYRSKYTNFISSFSPEVTMNDASLIKNKEYYLFAIAG